MRVKTFISSNLNFNVIPKFLKKVIIKRRNKASVLKAFPLQFTHWILLLIITLRRT